MDSMRSLNRSLPSAQQAPPEQLLQAFKQAALSVTTLYKSAANGQESARQAGYQDAIDDLLKFMDRENLGVQDGDGWRVRQWATARYDGSNIPQSEADEDEEVETELTQPPTSPIKPQEADRPSPPPQPLPQPSSKESTPPLEQPDTTPRPHSAPVFEFSAGLDNVMQTDDGSASSSQEPNHPVRLEIINRANRNAHRHNNRHGSRSGKSTSQITGSKRRMPFPDISEIFNLNFDRKDNFDGGNGSGGGPKRSRLV